MRTSRENDRLRLKHMLDAAQVAFRFGQVTERQTVENNRLLQYGLAKAIQDVGEAASNLTLEFRSDHPDIPWRDITDMRNFLVHVNFEIDLDVLWDTVLEDLPPLIAQLEAILSEEDTSE